VDLKDENYYHQAYVRYSDLFSNLNNPPIPEAGNDTIKLILSFNTTGIEGGGLYDDLSGTASGTGAELTIASPANAATFPLVNSNYTQTNVIAYEALSSDSTDSINWGVNVQYETSGRKGKTSFTQNFATLSSGMQSQQYTSIGGYVVITASQAGLSTKETFNITGAQIPASSYNSLLTSLYTSGATPGLLEQIATYESGYTQFLQKKLFGVSALWPTEAFGGGSHIGLMQVAVTNGMAADFDYTQNAQLGANLFISNLAYAAKRLNRLAKANKGLSVTGVMIENEALSYYVVGGKDSYYIVTTDSNGNPQWAENKVGDPTGTSYADCVRTQVPPTRHSCN